MRKVLMSRTAPIMQVTTMIQGSFSFRAVNPLVKMTQSPTKHTTGKKEMWSQRWSATSQHWIGMSATKMKNVLRWLFAPICKVLGSYQYDNFQVLKQRLHWKNEVSHKCLPHSPFITVKTVTVREVIEFGDGGGFRRLNLLFAPIAFTSGSLVGPS